MNIIEELGLLIKSKYPVIFFETIDEPYALARLRELGAQMGLEFFQWSISEGLTIYDGEPYYKTQDPTAMLRMALELIKPKERGTSEGAIFVLKDFQRCLRDELSLRLFKDLINRIKNTRTTCVIVASQYDLPKDIECDSAHLIGGYPEKQEIEGIIGETVAEYKRTNPKLEISLNRQELDKILNMLKGLSAQQVRNVVNQCLLNDNALNAQDLTVIESYKRKVFDQEGLLEFCLTEDKAGIAGFGNLKQWLAERKMSFSQAHRTSALPAPKGVLLMGVQGCGKSLAIKAIARELGLPLYRLDLGRLYDKYIGETEKNLRKALMIADKLSPLCLWVDEIEKGFAASGGDIDGGVSQRILGTFLTWMQERKTNCFLAATANDVYRLPPEFLRKGRFDEIFFVDLPDHDSRFALFRIHLAKRNLDAKDFDLERLIQATEGFSGAEIEQAVIAALYRSSSKKEAVTTDHIVEQAGSTKPLSVLKDREISALREWAKERTIPA